MTEKRHYRSAFCSIAGIVIILTLPLVTSAAPVTTTDSGMDAAAIQDGVDAFRAILGDPNNGNNPGPLAGGRREINWDGGGATTASPAGTPFTGFQNTRGALFTTGGTGFLQTPLDAPEFLAINATYGTTFDFFSPVRIFTPLGSNVTDATFTLPGNPAIPAYVSAFAVVFSDVDVEGSATLEFFNLSNISLGVFDAPAFNNGLSFLGVNFDAGEQIGRVRITSGAVALGPNDSAESDVVVMDDFLYSEPQAVPEPTSVLLFGTGLAAIGTIARLRRKKARPAIESDGCDRAGRDRRGEFSSDASAHLRSRLPNVGEPRPSGSGGCFRDVLIRFDGERRSYGIEKRRDLQGRAPGVQQA